MYQSGASTVSITNITSIENNATVKGGFIYITATNSNLYIYSGSTSGCTAGTANTENIYSNSAKAYVHVKGTATKMFFNFDGTLFSGSGTLKDITDA